MSIASSLQSPLLADAPQLRHGFFTREASSPEDVAAVLNVDPCNLVLCKQVHSTRALFVREPWSAPDKPEADAIVTTTKGIALGILTADCAPVLFADPEAGVIAAAHAGWRGALEGVLESTLCLMEGKGASRERIKAAVGPCIWQGSYEVSDSFIEPFTDEDEANYAFFASSEKQGHFLFDLPGYVVAKLRKAGIAHVAPSPADTMCDERRFFSHRRGVLRGEPERGRLISCIVLND